MRLAPPPGVAGWAHVGSRVGVEAAVLAVHGDGHRLVGHTTAIEGEAAWSVGYDVVVDAAWATRSARVTGLAADGPRPCVLARDAAGRWRVDGEDRPDLDGCVDVDLESSAVTNTLPLHRIAFAPGVPVGVPAAFVRADDLRVERLEQSYELMGDVPGGHAFRYASATFDFACVLRVDRAGLVVDYPGIAVRRA